MSMQRLDALTAVAIAVWGQPHPAQAAESGANSLSHLEVKPLDEGRVALLPVLEGNLDAIRVLQRAGVDYSKLRFKGASAIDFAKQSGNDALLNALTAQERTL